MLSLILEAAIKTVIFVMIVPPRMIINVKTIAANLKTWKEMRNNINKNIKTEKEIDQQGKKEN